MPTFSDKSERILARCDARLHDICCAAIGVYDFTIISGYRDEAEQNQLLASGKSMLAYPDSKHNSNPSLAIDIAPYPVDWNDQRRFYLLAGVMLATAQHKGVALRWGGDWDGDGSDKNERFRDLGHFEIV